MLALLAAVTLAIWLVIGTVLGVEAICAAPHVTPIGEAALLTAFAWGVGFCVAGIVFGPLAEYLDRR